MSEIKQNALPCPLCSAKMKRIKNGYEHPSSQCVLSGFVITDVEVKKWNTRKPLERIVERLEEKQTEYEKISEQKYFDMPQACYYKGYEEGFKGAIKICKEEGGIE